MSSIPHTDDSNVEMKPMSTHMVLVQILSRSPLTFTRRYE